MQGKGGGCRFYIRAGGIISTQILPFAPKSPTDAAVLEIRPFDLSHAYLEARRTGNPVTVNSRFQIYLFISKRAVGGLPGGRCAHQPIFACKYRYRIAGGGSGYGPHCSPGRRFSMSSISHGDSHRARTPATLQR